MLADVNLLYTNSVQYNGELHSITAIAAKIVQTCKEQFEEHAEQFAVLEQNLERQVLSQTTDQPSMNDDDWQQMMTTESVNPFTFPEVVEGNSRKITKKAISFLFFSIMIQMRITIWKIQHLACHLQHSLHTIFLLWNIICK